MKRAGISRFVFIVGHLRKQVVAHIEKNHASLNAMIIEQVQQQGIVHAISCAKERLVGEPFAIYCPDNYFADYYDLRRCLRLWTPSIASAVLVHRTDEWTRNRGLFYGSFERHPGVALKVERIQSSEAAGWISTGFSVEGVDFFEHLDKITQRDGEKRLFDVWRSELESGEPVVAVPMEGKLFDISSAADVATLSDELNSPAEGVAVILRTSNGRFLLVQRDKKVGIRYPGYWALFGGTVDPGETPEDAACRELEEELELLISSKDLRKVTQYVSNLKKEYVYMAPLVVSIEALILREGSRMKLFDGSELLELNIRDDDRQALLIYLER